MKMEVPGFVAGGIAAGIKKNGKPDLAVIFSEVPAAVAGVFTTNQVQAAPVVLTRERISTGSGQAVIVNSGSANACTGEQGMQDARAMARIAAQALGIEEDLVSVASTGVIGRPLNLSAVEAAMPKLVGQLHGEGLLDVASAIMTTDTFPKTAARQVRVSERDFTVAAVAKGAGMIRPDMATMLCFVCTDVEATPARLRSALTAAVAGSFNAVTVDGDTSTNDTVLIFANGRSGVSLDDPVCAEAFQGVLNDALLRLALDVVRDGEGATKLVSIVVKGAQGLKEARQIAYTVAESPLVKTAFFGADANWGRIMAAIGRSGVRVDPQSIDISIDKVALVRNGLGCGEEAEAAATAILKGDRFAVLIDLKLGPSEAVVHTCDLSLDYVKINADYRS